MKERLFLKDTPYWIIRKDKVKKRLWSGGTVDQLFISPEDADFAKKDFIFRVSTATVDVEESLFTFFDNYDRMFRVSTATVDVEESLFTFFDNYDRMLIGVRPTHFTKPALKPGMFCKIYSGGQRHGIR